MVTIEEIDQLARMPHSVVGSVQMGFNVGGPLEDDVLKQKLWQYLGLTRVYTKRKGRFRFSSASCCSAVQSRRSHHPSVLCVQELHLTWPNP